MTGEGLEFPKAGPECFPGGTRRWLNGGDLLWGSEIVSRFHHLLGV